MKEKKSSWKIENLWGKIKQNKWFCGLFLLNVLLALVDYITTIMYTHKELLEMNPLFKLTGHFYPILIFNAIALTLFGYYYFWSKREIFKFAILTELVLLIFIRCMVIKNAVIEILAANPVTAKIIGVAPITVEQIKIVLAQNPNIIAETQKQVFTIEWVTLATGILAFVVWWFDNKHRIKDSPNKTFRRRKK